MAVWRGNFSGRAVRINVELYEYGSAYHDRANNRSLHRFNVWLDKTNNQVYTYNLDRQKGKSASVSGPTGTHFSRSNEDVTYDFRPSGSQVTLWQYATDVWIKHNSTGGGSASAWSSFSADVIGSASASGSIGMTQLFAAPSAPTSPSVQSIAGTTAVYKANDGNNNGSAITSRTIQVATDSGFSTVVKTYSPSSFNFITMDGLDPSTDYWVRSRAGNAIGQGSWSAAVAFSTITIPDAPFLTAMSDDPHGATLYLEDPIYPPTGILDRVTEVALDEDFTNIFTSFTVKGSLPVTGLPRQATTYYARSRVLNAAGWGPYTVVAFKTAGNRLTAWLKDGGVWKEVSVWVRDEGVWHHTQPYVLESDTWRPTDTV